jgi:hypothetical protein
MLHRLLNRLDWARLCNRLGVVLASGCVALGIGCGGGRSPAGGHGSHDAADSPSAGSSLSGAAALPSSAGASSVMTTATAAPTPVGAVSEPAGGFVTTGPLVDPKKIVGTVYSKQMSDGMPPVLDATVTTTTATPKNDYLVEWDIALRDAQGHLHHLYSYAPLELPVPVRAGEAVRVRTSSTGGGPNLRYSIGVHSAAGVLLLAVNEPPQAWSVARGKSVGKTPMGGYDQLDYGVAFEHAGQRFEPAYVTWAQLTVGPRTYYVWGHAAERALHPGKAPMPDYVGGWLDFAIVLAR